MSDNRRKRAHDVPAADVNGAELLNGAGPVPNEDEHPEGDNGGYEDPDNGGYEDPNDGGGGGGDDPPPGYLAFSPQSGGLHVAVRPRILVAVGDCLGAQHTKEFCTRIEYDENFNKQADVKIVMSQGALNQVHRPDFTNIWMFTDADQATFEPEIPSPLSFELVEWADMLVISPLDPHLLAKIYYGFCDDLISKVVKIWPYPRNTGQGDGKPLVICPDMSSNMSTSPANIMQIQELQNDDVLVVQPNVNDDPVTLATRVMEILGLE